MIVTAGTMYIVSSCLIKRPAFGGLSKFIVEDERVSAMLKFVVGPIAVAIVGFGVSQAAAFEVPKLDVPDQTVSHIELAAHHGGRGYIMPRRRYGGGGNWNSNGGNWSGNGGHWSGNGGHWNGHHGHWNGNYGYNNWPAYGIGLGFGFPYYNDNYYSDNYYSDNYYGGGGHVQWCLNRYRSYSPRTDTFMGYDGHRYLCRSP
jgi:BA14K-like protein